MNGHCCQSRYARLKWPALIVMALMLFAWAAESSHAEDTVTKRVTEQTVENGPVKLTVAIDRNEVQVAEPFQLTLTATAPQGVRVQYPDLDGKLGTFFINQTKDTFDVPAGANRTWTRVLQLESYSSGNVEIPSITLTYTDSRSSTADTASDAIKTPPFAMSIMSEVEANADPTRFRDIKGVVELNEPAAPSNAWIVWTAAGLGILSLAGVWGFTFSRKVLTPSQWALRELKHLERSGLIETLQFDPFFCRATDILRNYLERRFAISAPHLSTVEFLEQVETESQLNDEQRMRLQAILKQGDAIKFARFSVTAADAGRALNDCRAFVEETTALSKSQPMPKFDTQMNSTARSSTSVSA